MCLRQNIYCEGSSNKDNAYVTLCKLSLRKGITDCINYGTTAPRVYSVFRIVLDDVAIVTSGMMLIYILTDVVANMCKLKSISPLLQTQNAGREHI